MLQIHHAMSDEILEPFLLAPQIAMSEIMIVASLYSLLRLYSSMRLFVTVGVFSIGTVCATVLTIETWLAARETESSEKYIATAATHPVNKIEIAKKLFLRSCYPLKRKVGGTFVLSKHSIPAIFQDIVISNLINLLIAY